jgi:hypothetical protein
MNIQLIKPLQTLSIEISKIKEQIIDELPHYGHQSLYYNNHEITTGLLNNKIEIKTHLKTGQLQWYNDETVHYIDLFTDDITKSLNEIAEKYGLKGPEITLENVDYVKLDSFDKYAMDAKYILELFRMKLRDNLTLIHLWPHHFDFSVEWFTGNTDEQIGTGISPGDESSSEPYLYMNPYPFNEKVLEQKLPLGIWNTDGWKGVKIELKDLLKYPPQNAASKLHDIFDVVKMNFN